MTSCEFTEHESIPCHYGAAGRAPLWQVLPSHVSWAAQEEKYKEGCALLQISLLSFVENEKPDTEITRHHSTVWQCAADLALPRGG